MSTLPASDIAAYQRDGFLIVRGLFKAEELEPLVQALASDHTLSGEGFDMHDVAGSSLHVAAWTAKSNTLLGLLPYARRTYHVVELLLGEPVYHWHSKLTIKHPQSAGRVEWHQDYGAWYYEGCLAPALLTVGVAIEPATKESGCLELIKGSHLLGRMDHEYVDDAQHRVDPERLQLAEERSEVVAAELNPGDAVFFHCNTLHGSDGNTSGEYRTLLLSTYNTISNSPFGDNQAARRYRPIPVVDDAIFETHRYPDVVNGHVFLRPEPAQMQGFGASTFER